MRADGSRDLSRALNSTPHCWAVWRLLLESAGQAGSPSRAPTPQGQPWSSWAATPAVRVIVTIGIADWERGIRGCEGGSHPKPSSS